jgi:hypothetical protein
LAGVSAKPQAASESAAMSAAVDDAVETVTGRLSRLRERWWGCSLGTALVLAAAGSLAVLLACVLVDALSPLPQGVLAALFITWVTVTLALAALVVMQHRRAQRSLQAVARRVEMEFPEAGSHLINLVQFAEEEEDEGGFRRAAMVQAAAATKRVPLEKTAYRQTRRRRLRFCLNTPRDLAEAGMFLAGLVALGFVLAAVIPTWASSWWRVLEPWNDIPPVGRVQIVSVTPGDAEVLVGSGVTISGEIDNSDGEDYRAILHITKEDQEEATLDMQPDASRRHFKAHLPQVTVPLHYRLEIGDSQTSPYTLSVRPKPAIAEVEVSYFYPPYLGLPKQTVTQKHGDLEAPQFTIAHLTIRPLGTVARGHILVDGEKVSAFVTEEGRALRTQLFLTKNTTYTVHLFTEAGQTDSAPRVNLIRVRPDNPPTVQLVQPAGEGTAAVGKPLAVVVRAADDHGLGLVRLEMKHGEPGALAPGEVQAVKSWEAFADPCAAVLRHELTLQKKQFKQGEVVLLRAVAQDRRRLELNEPGIQAKLAPQETTTPWLKVRLIAPEAQAARSLTQLDALRTALFKILTQQIQARTLSPGIGQAKTLEGSRALAAEVRQKQAGIQKATTAVVQSIGQAEDAARLVIKRAANKLALGEMLEAVKQAEALGRVPEQKGLAAPARGLAGTQDRIIDVLRRMLNELRKDSAEALAEMGKRPGTELPADVQNKLRELKDKLKDFLKQQKKVIDATDSLAKKAVEDFSDKDEKKLKDLAAAEDDWSRFLAEKHSDFSKLPEQDFANPSFLDEMVAVETELKMAKDALTKKTADIAVPLEQLGAEMAKEMTTNIEKWLPDTPDRERWSQEEPLTGDMKEAPMAELPKELEDLVGELMEQEEDLFNELEDASSSWADSIDKGAGWDAADGPISNMSAKGVTGNRLPNQNEIGGRSGEGRQGQASGEFVGNEAVGKGGRKTPSRLTPEPHQKGQVKDSSKDPPGGATGGGKESGQGAEGLHGPVPNRPDRELGRLAKKQAELRNKAEAVDLRFKVLRYQPTDLKKLTETMKAVENDLKGGQYRTALRRRDVLLQGLGQVRTYLKGEFAVRKDQTSNLPTNVQKEVLGSMTEPSPTGWDELNRQYFERLSGPPAPAAPPNGKR